MSVPFPLPDLPRISHPPYPNVTALSLLALEHRDLSALTRLPDALRDANRDADAAAVISATGRAMAAWLSTGVHTSSLWEQLRRDVSAVVWFDIFDWEQCLGVLGERYAPKTTGATGSLTVNVRVPDRQRNIPTLHGPAAPLDASSLMTDGTITITGTFAASNVPEFVVADLHATESHPDYEYAHTSSPKRRPLGYGSDRWERNPHAPPSANRAGWMRRRLPQ